MTKPEYEYLLWMCTLKVHVLAVQFQNSYVNVVWEFSLREVIGEVKGVGPVMALMALWKETPELIPTCCLSMQWSALLECIQCQAEVSTMMLWARLNLQDGRLTSFYSLSVTWPWEF